jgi:hypothetical protein
MSIVQLFAFIIAGETGSATAYNAILRQLLHRDVCSGHLLLKSTVHKSCADGGVYKKGRRKKEKKAEI